MKLLKTDSGVADITSLMIAAAVTGIFATVAAIASFAIVPSFEQSSVKASMSEMAAEQAEQFVKKNTYLTSDQLSKSYPSVLAELADNQGCYTIVGESYGKAFILESGQSQPAEVKDNTTAGCVGETTLVRMLGELGAKNSGRTGKEVLAPVKNFQLAGSYVTWDSVAGATGYTLTQSVNGSAATSRTVTTSSASFTATPGSVVRFTVRPNATGKIGNAYEFVMRFDPTPAVPNGEMDLKEMWYIHKGDWEAVDRLLCNGATSGKYVAGRLTPGAVILSNTVLLDKVAGTGTVKVIAESCGDIAPRYTMNFYDKNGKIIDSGTRSGALKGYAHVKTWDLRTSENIKTPEGAVTAKVEFANSSSTQLYIDNVDIVAVR